MVARVLIPMGLTLLCGSCAYDSPPRAIGYQADLAQRATPAAEALAMPARRSMADKVLAAIALERVTGRKPDPARLTAAD